VAFKTGIQIEGGYSTVHKQHSVWHSGANDSDRVKGDRECYWNYIVRCE
jgi:hypothetical protein